MNYDTAIGIKFLEKVMVWGKTDLSPKYAYQSIPNSNIK